MKMKQNPDNESGMMVVEAVIGFTAFIMVCLGIVFLTNIFILHNRVQFAINSAAHEIASYSYVYSAFSLKDAEDQVEKDGEKYTKPIDDTAYQVVDTINKLNRTLDSINGVVPSGDDITISRETLDKLGEIKDNASSTVSSGKETASMIAGLFKDPKSFATGMVFIGVSGLDYELKKLVGSTAAGALSEKYLKFFDRGADDYLKSFGVVGGYSGLDFGGSSVFCDDSGKRIVDIVVEYDVDFSFIDFVFPSRLVHVVQRVSVCGWVDGDGLKVGVGGK